MANSAQCLHECSVHKPRRGALEAIQLVPGGRIHAAVQNEAATLCGYHIESFTESAFYGWWENHSDMLCHNCVHGGVRL